MDCHQCSMCPYFSPDTQKLLHHVVRRHKNAPSFIAHCNAKGCGASFRNYNSFKIHIKRRHQDYCSPYNPTDMIENQDLNDGLQEHIEDDNSELDTTRAEAVFLLKLKAGQNISDAAMQEVILSVRDLYQSRFDAMSKTLQGEAREDLLNFPDASTAFSELDTKYKRDKFLKVKLGAVVPKAVRMGDHVTRKKRKGKSRLTKTIDYGYIVPFLENLQSLLSMPEIQECLNDTPPVSDQLMTDIMDGAFVRNSDFLDKHPSALLFGAYSDDFELVNPIGSHTRKHKLCVFYYILLNIPPEFRSKLSVIQLIAVAKSTDVKRYGTDILLKDFLTGLKSLHKGVNLSVGAKDQLHHGLLVFYMGDTPAAQAAGGFKEGVGGAHKPCRTCDIEANSLKDCCFPSECPDRDELEHRDRCETLESLSRDSKLHWSKEYGINGKSFLYSVPMFQLTKCILHDPMHVILEGVDRLEVRLLLTHLTQTKKYFSLADLGSIIDNFNYSSSQANDKPQKIQAKDLQAGSTLRQSAASMKNLVLLLPFMIGHLIAEDDLNWGNFLRLQQINSLCFSPVASERTYNSLMQLIGEHHKSFKQLYPDQSFTPKLHYMVHFPKQLYLFGPLRHHSCMRMEAKHGLFKARKWRNFKAIAKSVSEYHQRWLCLQQIQASGFKSETYLYCGDEVKVGTSIAIGTFEHFEILKAKCAELIDDGDDILLTSQVKIRGIIYKWPQIYSEIAGLKYVMLQNVDDTWFI